MSKEEQPDPLIDEIYEIRRQISAEHGDDLDRLFEHYDEYERQLGDEVTYASPKRGKSAA